MELSIIIVNYNGKYFPRLCIEAIKRNKTDFPYEIIVIDNCSTDQESLEYLEKADQRKELKLIKLNKNLGFAKANNIAAKEAIGKYFLILNPDVFIEENFLQKMHDYLKENSEIGVLGPKLVYTSDKIQYSCRREENISLWDLIIKRSFLSKFKKYQKRIDHYLMKDFDHNETKDVDLLVGACMLIPREVFKQVKGFDERYFLFMEDFDLCKKIRKNGLKVTYYPKAKAVHNHKRLSGGKISKLFYKKVTWLHLVSAIKYFWKWRKNG